MQSRFNMFKNWSDKDKKEYQQQFPINRQLLKEKLESSAFRRGISTALVGMTKLAPSDHCPITAQFNEISLLSWNLLSDEHTDNFLIDIGEKTYYSHADGIEWRSLFENFGNFIFKTNPKNTAGIYKINITEQVLNAFVEEEKLKAQYLKTQADLSVADKVLAGKLEQAATTAKNAEKWVQLVLDHTHPNHEDLKSSLSHIIEIMYSMKEGPLQWKKRLDKLKENKLLIKKLASHDFLCFQECTNPTDMLNLLQEYVEKTSSNKNFIMLTNTVKDQTQDHCVLIYNENKFKLQNKINFGLYFNPRTNMQRKPCIVAKSLSLTEQKPLIVGSIHHSGRGKSEMVKIIEITNNLMDNSSTPAIILGDYNHQKEYFANDLSSNFALKMPADGTMAGFEHGNNNKPIDGALTNYPNEVYVQVLQQNTFAEQVVLPLELTIDIDPPEEENSLKF